MGSHAKKYMTGRNQSSNKDSWLLSYSDVVTLLLAFFVIMAAISSVNQSKYEEVKAGMSQAVSDQVVKKPFHEIKDEIDSIILKGGMEKAVEVDLSSKGLTVEFLSSTFYRSGEAEIMDSALPVLNNVAEALKNISYDDHKISVEGHTDDVPIKSEKFPSNWELSVQRATSVVRYFIEKGIAKERLKASGYADIEPKAPNLDETGKGIPDNREKNRRVIITIYR